MSLNLNSMKINSETGLLDCRLIGSKLHEVRQYHINQLNKTLFQIKGQCSVRVRIVLYHLQIKWLRVLLPHIDSDELKTNSILIFWYSARILRTC